MTLKYNGTTIEKVIYNGAEVEKVIYNGVTVFEAVFDVTSSMASNFSNDDYNIRDYFILRGWDGVQKVKGTITMLSGAHFYASATSSWALTVDRSDFPAGSDFTLKIDSGAYIIGCGGKGGDASSSQTGGAVSSPGLSGGPALRVFGTGATFRVINNGYIAGGGGGGGSVAGSGCCPSYYSGGGGGGAGKNPGLGGNAATDGSPGTTTAGGAGASPGFGATAGNGGVRGGVGNDSSQGSPGGAAGTAITGHSLITGGVTGTGSIYGPVTG